MKSQLWLLLFFLSILGYPQQKIYKQYTSDDGLGHDLTYDLIQDHNGYIWIGTDNGLSRFNGTTFKNYGFQKGLLSNYIINIHERSPDELVLSTWGAGLHLLKNDSIHKIPILQDSISKINKLIPVHKDLYYTNNAFYSFHLYNLKDTISIGYQYLKDTITKRTKVYPVKDLPGYNYNLHLVESIANQKIYVHADEVIQEKNPFYTGVYLFEKENLTPVFGLLKDKLIRSVHAYQDLFYIFGDQYLYVFKKDTLIQTISLPELKHKTVTKIKRHQHDLLFITHDTRNSNRELYRMNLKDQKLTNLSETYQFHSKVSSFIIDNQQHLWVSTYGEGIYRIPNSKHTFFGAETFSSFDLKNIESYNDHLILLGNNTLYSFKENQIIDSLNFPFHTEQFTIDRNAQEILLTNITSNTRFNKGAYRLQHPSLDLIHDSFSLRLRDSIYGVTFKGSFLSITKNHQQLFETTFHNAVKNAFIDSHKLYIQLERQGYRIYELPKEKFISSWSTKNGLISNKINTHLQQSDTLWLASDRGLQRITPKDTTEFTTQQGLLSNHIHDLTLDKHGQLWLATQKGLHVFYQNRLYPINATFGQFSSFTTDLLATDDYIFTVGNKGLFRYHNQKPFTPTQNTSLLIEQDSCRFKIEAINLINGKTTRIAYRLNGQKWILTQNGLLDFSNLKQNFYTLEFRYKDESSYWHYTDPYHFVIKAPWYEQTWWYVSLVIAIASILLLITIKLLRRSIRRNAFLKQTLEDRERLRKELSTVRENVAQDFHDELGNTLASISVLSNLVLLKLPKNSEIYSKIEKIKTDSKSLYSGMRDFIWSMDQKSDRLDELQLYLNDFGEQLFVNTSIDFIVTSSLDTTKTTLPYYWSKQLVFIYKEAMTNALKYSQATEIELSITLRPDQVLEIVLKDNGIGFETEKLQRINGLNNMKLRAKRIHSELHIISTHKGTKIIFEGGVNK